MNWNNLTEPKNPINNISNNEEALYSLFKNVLTKWIVQERNSMSQFQNTNVVFRCPAPLKAKMRAFAKANDTHLSTFIRSACVEVLRREMKDYHPNIPSEAEIQKHLEEMI